VSTSNETNIQLQAILDAAKAIVQCKHDGNGLCDGGYSLCGSCGAVSKFGDPWELSPSVKRLVDALEVLPPMRDVLPDTIVSFDDVKAFTTAVSKLASTRGLDCLVAVSAPRIGWYVQGVPGFAALGLAHQAVCSMQKFVDGTGSGPELVRVPVSPEETPLQ